MLIYNILYFLALLFILLNKTLHNKKIENLYFILLFLVFVFISGLRLDISSDYKEYKYIFEKINENGIFSDYFIEIGYLYLNKIVGFFTNNFNVLLFTVAFISISCKFYFINSISQDRLLSALLFLSFYLLLYDMGAIRRGLALGFSSISILFYLKDKRLVSILFLFIGAFFHSSILVLLPFLLIKKFHISQKLFIIFVLTSYILQYILNNLTIFQFLGQSNNPIVSKAFGYFESGDYFNENSSFTIGFLIRVLLIILLIRNRPIIINHSKYFDKLIYLYSISIFILIIFDKLRIFSSVAIYFKFIEVILIPLLITSYKRFARISLYILILTYLYFSFYKLINNPLEKDFYPYQSILN